MADIHPAPGQPALYFFIFFLPSQQNFQKTVSSTGGTLRRGGTERPYTVFRYFGAHLNWILYALEVQVPIQSEVKIKKKTMMQANLILQKKNDSSRKLEGEKESCQARNIPNLSSSTL